MQEKMDGPSPGEDNISSSTSRKKGGMITMPFIIVNETFEKVASYGLLANMIIYLMGDYNMAVARGASILFVWSATSNFVPILGAFLSDSYLGRFKVIALASIISLLGMTLLWLTAIIPSARPAECSPPYTSCDSPSSFQLAFLFFSFALMSIGAGGIRPCSLAFGADQVDHPDKQKKVRILQSFFNWYYASVGVSLMIAVTVIVYIQDSKGWKVGLGVPAVLMLVSTILFLVGSPFYVKNKADKSLLTGLAQVVVAAVRKRNLALPRVYDKGDLYYHSKDSNLKAPTDTLRFLNKACIIANHTKDVKPDGSATNTWTLCSVQQVEDLKSLVKVMPIWSTGIVIAVTISQHSFQVVQATTMDRHLGLHFQIPAGSYGVFGIFTLTIWVAIYDRIVVPLLRRFTGRPGGLSLKQRMAIGLLLSCAATATAASVERARRRTAIRQGLADNVRAVVDMSAMWLVPQHCLSGLAEAFNAIGQIEFYYSELPKSMSSIGVALFTLGMGVGNLMASAIVGLVDDTTRTKGGVSWVSSNLNRGHYDYYYWLLAFLSAINFLYFLVCSCVYGPFKEHEMRGLEDGEEMKEGNEQVRSRESSVVL